MAVLINDNTDNTYSKMQIATSDTTLALDDITLAPAELLLNWEDEGIYYGKPDGTKGVTATTNQIQILIDELAASNADLQAQITAIVNKCPHDIGDYYTTESIVDPATKWAETTWTKIEGRMILGSSVTYPLGSLGGASTLTLLAAHMPSHKHRVDSHIHTQPEHNHSANGGWSNDGSNSSRFMSDDGGSGTRTLYTNNAGGQNTGGTAPYTDYQGSGTAFGSMNPYIAANIYRRTA